MKSALLKRFFVIFIVLCNIKISSAISAPISLDAYGSLPAISQLKLSPNAKNLALIQNVKGNLVLMSIDLKTSEQRLVLQSDNVNVLLNWYTWANDDILLISAAYPTHRGTVKYTSTRLYKFDLTKPNEVELLVKPRGSRNEKVAQFQDNVISLLPEDPDNILMAIAFDSVNKPSVYKVNVRTKKRRRIERAKSFVTDWYADQQGNARISLHRDETNIFYKLYDQEGDFVRKLWSYEIFEREVVHVLGFDVDPNTLFIRALHQGKYAVFKVNLLDKSLTKELVYFDEKYDVDGRLLYSPKTHEVVGLSHSSKNDNKTYWNNEYIAFKEALNKAIPDADNTIISMSKDMQHYVLFSTSKNTAGDYFLGNRKLKSLSYLGSLYPEVNEQNYAGKELVLYPARDGMKIEAYLTKPKSYKTGAKLPAIILPHGGPMARDTSGFDYWSELFASRGYIVLQPNFRGSSGYGYDFEMAAIEGWGKAMQNDLQDAVHWLNAQNIIDEEKVCIAGASYGGYAALMASVLHADTFKCAASFAGVSDIKRIVRRSRRFTNAEVVKKQFGDDYDKLEAVSPVNFAENIEIPILLVHGTDDRVVPVQHSQAMADELSDYDKDVRYVEIENANHHLSVQSHRIQTLNEMVKFFDKHLMSN
ncbi:S9 family peptidase [Colwellia sp. RSH04]|uniref:alpha/beta hydrolase family protein n=1 Tax=Colwellia sp. RSH04 TaxID=2305464 RepID=UPI0015FB9599|nr:S9 family peptidase [Colwellia sp. RSH04]